MNDDALPLRDLQLPEAVGWWPLAPGWWVLLALSVAGFAYLSWRWYRAWRFNAPRRYALRELARFEAAYLDLVARQILWTARVLDDAGEAPGFWRE